METATGLVRRITFHNPDNGYTIARIEPETNEKKAPEGITAVGFMTGIAEGQTVEVTGAWEDHPKYGRQLKVESFQAAFPTTEEGIRRFLSSGLVKGVGKKFAERIVAQFGRDTLKVLDKEPRRLLEVPGLGRKRAGMLARAWSGQRRIRDAMVFLQSHGVGSAAAVKIFRKYEQEAIAKVSENPYRLQRDIDGIGFVTADAVASQLGIARDAPQRIQAGIGYLLESAAGEGHVFLPQAEVVEKGSELLQVGAELFPEALEALEEDRQIVRHQERCFLPYLYHAEVRVAAFLERLLRNDGAGAEFGEDPETELDLSPSQGRAVETALREKVMVLTGGPGTGKTTVTRVILRHFEKAGLRVALCSPTGRAAKRLAEATGREAKTIHRLLEFMPAEGRFRRGRNDPVEADAVIVDETSMIDVPLMHALLRALSPQVRLLLVGDADQLPSVGPGNVMGDIIASGRVPVALLTEIHRQERRSRIVVNAHRINAGDWPELGNSRDGDFFFLEEQEPPEAAALISDLVGRRLPAHGGYDPVGDIQVLTPMYRGETGAINLNRLLQQRLNPGGKVCRKGERELRVGDKVLQVRNNYERAVFNGDLGRILAFDSEEGSIRVRFDSGVSCEYGANSLDEIVPAYAISVHRAQGSEFPVVVLPLTTQHYPMLQRNLLYTAITRARSLLVVVGGRRALGRAISNDEVARRYTALGERLRDSS